MSSSGKKEKKKPYGKSRSSSGRGTANRLKLGEARKLNPLRAKSDFICRYRCNNSLPDIPHEPKLLKYPFDPMRYIRRGSHGTGLEKTWNRIVPMQAEPDLGVPIDLIDPRTYTVTGREPELHPDDQELIDNQVEIDHQANTGAAMPWFMSTQYVDSHVQSGTTYSSHKGVAEWEGDFTSPRMQKKIEQEDSIDAKVATVRRTFETAAEIDEQHKNGTLKHPTKRGVTAVEVLPLFPDVSRWGISFTHMAFDEPPLQQLRREDPLAKKGRETDLQGMPIIQGLQSANEQWMAYLMPLKKRAREGVEEAAAAAAGEQGGAAAAAAAAAAAVDEEEHPEGTIEYRRIRSYTFAPKEQKDTSLLIEDKDSGMIMYKSVDKFFRMHKRRKTEDTDSTLDDAGTIFLTRHDPTEEDLEEEAYKRMEINAEENAYGDAGGGPGAMDETLHMGTGEDGEPGDVVLGDEEEEEDASAGAAAAAAAEEGGEGAAGETVEL